MDGSGSDGPPSVVSDQGLAGGGGRIRSCAPGSMSFFAPLENRRKEQQVAVWLWDVGGGAARSRSHRLSLARCRGSWWSLGGARFHRVTVARTFGGRKGGSAGKERERSATGKKREPRCPARRTRCRIDVGVAALSDLGKAWSLDIPLPAAAGRHSLTAAQNNNNAVPLHHNCLGLGSHPIRRASVSRLSTLTSLTQQGKGVVGFSSVAIEIFSLLILPEE